MDALRNLIKSSKQEIRSKYLQDGKSYFKRSEVETCSNDKPNKAEKRSSDKIEDDVPEKKPKSVDLIEEALSSKDHILPPDEVAKQLRERREPIRLFGESAYEAFKRLKRLQILEPEQRGFRNDMRDCMNKVEEQYMNDCFQEDRNVPKLNSGVDVVTKEAILSDEDIEDLKKKLSQRDDNVDVDIVLRFFKHLLSVWGNELNSRSNEEKQSFRGKQDSVIYTQTVEYVRPFFRKMKTSAAPPDIVDSLVKIVQCLLERNYIRAHEIYSELSVGNAPWPLGVTNHGIHSRTAQEKIHAKNVAHVLNDETQRKYIQAIKRLMTRCQKYYPTDPSRCVMFYG